MKIVLFNRFFHPDTSATSQMASDLAFYLAGRGHEVHAVTSRVGPADPRFERVSGVTIHRVAAAIAQPHGLGRRAFAYAAYYAGARDAARRLLRREDVVVLKTDPPMLSAAVGGVARNRGARVVVWLQDLFPEVAQAYGVPGTGGLSGAALRSIRDRSLAAADRVVAIGERMANRLDRDRLGRDRVAVIRNWADGESIVPIDAASSAMRRAWNLEGKFVVAYSGNLGRVHEFDTLLDAARRLRGDPGIRFLVVGRGPRQHEIASRVEREAFDNVRLEPHQERGALAQSLGAADVHVSILRPEFEGLVLPSKLYGIMAAGRPTVFVGDRDGETAAILARHGCGLSVATGDAAALAAAIVRLRDRRDERMAMGERARRAFQECFAMPIAMREWEALLASLAQTDCGS